MFCTNCGKELPDGSTFCTNCGMKVSSESPKGQDCTAEAPQPEAFAAAEPHVATQMQDETNWKEQQASEKSTAAFSSERKREDDANAIARQIIGKNTEYYLTQLGQMQQGAKSKMNWASFFFSLWHASYRNMWRAWLRAVRLSLLIDLCAWLLAGIFLFIQPVVSLILLLVAIAAGIWQIVAQILFAKHFNHLYMQHVEQKVAKHDHSPDPSGGRVVISYLITTGIGAIIASILSAVMLGGAMMAFSELDMEEDTSPDISVVTPDLPEADQTVPDTSTTGDKVNMNDFIGVWDVDRYNSYMDGYVGFVIENNNDQFYFSANGVWNQGNRVTNIEYAQIELNYDGTQAGGYYQDDRGNTGDIILDFENGELYLTITADGSGDYSFAMSHEHCTRDSSQVNLVENMSADGQYAINIFLSNFSEVGFAYDKAFTGSDPNQIMHFAFVHNIVNNPEMVKYENNQMSINSAAITSTVEKYFDIAWRNQSTSDYLFEDDRYYATAASGENYSICSVADTMYENEDGSYTVFFSIYEGPYGSSMMQYYSYSGRQAESDPSLNWNATGTATVGVEADSDGNIRYYLLSYEIL